MGRRRQTSTQTATTETTDLHSPYLKRVTRRRGTASGKRHSDKMGGVFALCEYGEGTSALENDVELPFTKQASSRCRVQSRGFGSIAAFQPIPVYRNRYPSCAVPRNKFGSHWLSRRRTSLLCNCRQTATVSAGLSVWDRELFRVGWTDSIFLLVPPLNLAKVFLCVACMTEKSPTLCLTIFINSTASV